MGYRRRELSALFLFSPECGIENHLRAKKFVDLKMEGERVGSEAENRLIGTANSFPFRHRRSS
jgi:hypothetical protein